MSRAVRPTTTPCPSCGALVRTLEPVPREHPPAACVVCTRPLPYQGRGRPRRWCPECRRIRSRFRISDSEFDL